MKPRIKSDYEPIAIVGMSFRFPGDIASEADFWHALTTGRDAVTEVGTERWATKELSHPNRAEPGRSITFSAGVLSNVEAFDANFFGMSPREAAWLDPQQRLLLELTWEAIEDAGQMPEVLEGSDCAVFVGLSSLDYGVRGVADLASISSHTMTGNTLSMASNRLSYVFDLHGPSLTVDTACSSSMVALHQACRALHNGEAPMALVGSANLLLHPYPFVGFTKAAMISGRGRCRTFDASADGYVRAEGGAMLLLKPLAQAQADKNNIHAIIKSSGVNADGSDKSGITIPSRAGQVALMKEVLLRANISSDRLDYIEAHGTGTSVGDPIEAKAIGEVYGKGRSKPLLIGSVKTNLGHLEAASGMAGLVKTILMLKNKKIPPSLHFETPNPNIPFAELNLQVATGCADLESTDPELIMAVNSFGFGGANAHVILQSASLPKKALSENNVFPPLFLSAKNDSALQQLAGRYAELLNEANRSSSYDICWSAAFHRQSLEKRLALAGSTPQKMGESLRLFAQQKSAPDILKEEAIGSGNLAFIYTGNGAQWLGMGLTLLKESDRFAEIMTEMDIAIFVWSGFSLLAELSADAELSRLDDTSVAQPLLFAIQVAITLLLREHGILPQAVTGHSVGEVVAAWAAGAMDLDQAIKLVCIRSQAQAKTRGLGRMAAVGMSEDDMRSVLEEGDYRKIEIAGINSPSNVSIAGDFGQLEQLQEALEVKKIFFKMLDLDYAFHSVAMDPVQAFFLENIGSIDCHDSKIDFISTVTGDLSDGGALEASYWWDNVRKPVRFGKAVNTLIARGFRNFVEISPHAILQRYITECLQASGENGRVLSTMRRNKDGLTSIEETALSLHLLRPHPDLVAIKKAYFSKAGNYVSLPAYPWQRETYSLPKTSESYELIQRTRVHPLLGWCLKEQEACWENIIDVNTYPYLKDHRVAGSVVFPAAGYVEMALAAAKEWFGSDSFELEEFTIFSPIILDTDRPCNMRVEFSPRDGSLRIFSRERLGQNEWGLNASCRLLGAPMHQITADMTSPTGTAGEEIDSAAHYHLTQSVGLEYGPAFQGFVKGLIENDTFNAFIKLPEKAEESEAYLLHPVLLDSCFQALTGFFKESIEAGKGLQLLPVKIDRLRFFGGSTPSRFEMKIENRKGRTIRCNLIMKDDHGNVVCAADRCAFRMSSMQRRKTHYSALWQIATKLVPHSAVKASGSADAFSVLTQATREYFDAQLSQTQQVKYFQQASPLMDALIATYAYEAFNSIETNKPGWLQDVMIDAASVPKEQRQFFCWLASILQRALLLQKNNDVWILESSQPPPPAEDIWRTVYNEFPELLSELLPVARVGRHLTTLLSSNKAEARKNQNSKIENLSGDSLIYANTNQALQAGLLSLARNWPENRRLRILEISSGQESNFHGLTQFISADNIDYVIGVFREEQLDHSKSEYSTLSFVTVAELDTKSMHLKADKLPEKFDIIILKHFLHWSETPSTTLESLCTFMADGARLVITEPHPSDAINFILGCDPSWWSGPGPTHSRLLTPESCAELLVAQKFYNIEVIREPQDENANGSYIILASCPPVTSIVSAPLLQSWLILYDENSELHGKDLASSLQEQGQKVAIKKVGSDADNAAHTFLREDKEYPIHQVIYMATGDMRDREAKDLCAETLKLIQVLAAYKKTVKLWIVTAGGAVVSQGYQGWNHNPSAAALWGMVRVAMNEYPSLDCTLIDLAEEQDIFKTNIILQREFLEPDGEKEIVLTHEGRFGLRLKTVPLFPSPQLADAARFTLDFYVAGQLRNLTWLTSSERDLEDDEVEVITKAAGLNFRDVMYAMGLLPDEAVENGFSGATLGLEFSGIVSRLGKNVTGYKIGDAVMGFGPSCFSSHIVTKINAITHKPEHWSFAQAATVPTAFFTVYYALYHLAQLQPGEKILIHGAAGGVGIAAIQIAKYLGAEIFVTAGTDEKRDFTHLLGADHVLDSRSLAFADDILALTNGEGIDVVLNSLAGEAINRNLRVLKPFGRFLELGKRDFFENTHIGLRPFKDNISYFGIDADQLLAAKPHLVARLFQEMMALFHEGTLSPLPYRAFTADKVIDAFRHMQQSRHIGKIVIDLADARIHVEENQELGSVRFHKNASYLVTGGLGGFGYESARWLAANGAGHLILVGRRGLDTPNITSCVRELEKLGAQVEVFACDITDYSALKNLFDTIQKTSPPLRGIIHAAMVLDDAMMDNLDASRFERVLSPKIEGAFNLHKLSLTQPIEHFILYSSVTTCIGNPGQSNYVAANNYLEAFALWRRSQGLPANCIGWGPIGDAGYLARNASLKDSLSSRLGAKPLESKRALEILGHILSQDIGQITVADFDTASLMRFLPSVNGPRFEYSNKSARTNNIEQDNFNISSLIEGKSTEEVLALIKSIMIAEAGKILSVSADRINITTPVQDLGMDSLMMVELALAIEQRFGINLAAMELSGNASSIERICEKISEKLMAPQDQAEHDSLTNLIDATLTRHNESISREDVAKAMEEHQNYIQENLGRVA